MSSEIRNPFLFLETHSVQLDAYAKGLAAIATLNDPELTAQFATAKAKLIEKILLDLAIYRDAIALREMMGNPFSLVEARDFIASRLAQQYPDTQVSPEILDLIVEAVFGGKLFLVEVDTREDSLPQDDVEGEVGTNLGKPVEAIPQVIFKKPDRGVVAPRSPLPTTKTRKTNPDSRKGPDGRVVPSQRLRASYDRTPEVASHPTFIRLRDEILAQLKSAGEQGLASTDITHHIAIHYLTIRDRNRALPNSVHTPAPLMKRIEEYLIQIASPQKIEMRGTKGNARYFLVTRSGESSLAQVTPTPISHGKPFDARERHPARPQIITDAEMAALVREHSTNTAVVRQLIKKGYTYETIDRLLDLRGATSDSDPAISTLSHRDILSVKNLILLFEACSQDHDVLEAVIDKIIEISDQIDVQGRGFDTSLNRIAVYLLAQDLPITVILGDDFDSSRLIATYRLRARTLPSFPDDEDAFPAPKTIKVTGLRDEAKGGPVTRTQLAETTSAKEIRLPKYIDVGRVLAILVNDKFLELMRAYDLSMPEKDWLDALENSAVANGEVVSELSAEKMRKVRKTTLDTLLAIIDLPVDRQSDLIDKLDQSDPRYDVLVYLTLAQDGKPQMRRLLEMLASAHTEGEFRSIVRKGTNVVEAVSIKVVDEFGKEFPLPPIARVIEKPSDEQVVSLAPTEAVIAPQITVARATTRKPTVETPPKKAQKEKVRKEINEKMKLQINKLLAEMGNKFSAKNITAGAIFSKLPQLTSVLTITQTFMDKAGFRNRVSPEGDLVPPFEGREGLSELALIYILGKSDQIFGWAKDTSHRELLMQYIDSHLHLITG